MGRWRASRRPRSAAAQRGQATYARRRWLDLFVNDYRVTILSPDNGAGVSSTTPTVVVKPESLAETPVDVQVEWRTQQPTRNAAGLWSPNPTYATSHTGVASGTTLDVSPPAPLLQTSWFYRVRAGSQVSGLWTDWTSPARYLDVQAVLGSTAAYTDMNVGVTQTFDGSVIAYSDMNVGAEEVLPTLARYSDLNVGLNPGWLLSARYTDLNVYPPTGEFLTAKYSDLNVDSTLRPIPHIWWIRPEQGREGYVFHVYGHGFGAFQTEWDGKVVLGALVCPVIRWERITALDPPDQIMRADDPVNDLRDPEHGWITVVVPVNAVSGMVQVVLEGGA